MPGRDISDKRFQKTVAALATSSNRRIVMRTIASTRPRPTIPGVVGVGEVGTGGGVGSPFTEPDADARTYHPLPRTVTSTDGVFTIELRDIETITMTDANGNEAIFKFAQPSS